MRTVIPSAPAVMTCVLGLFMVIASLGTVLPGFVHDRVPKQFTPVCNWMLSQFIHEPGETLVLIFARLSQVIIAVTELTIGVVMLAATFIPARRLVLTNLGVGLSMGLFGTFMLTMFAMHDKSLPAWNQYPAMLSWLGATWLVVALTDPSGKRLDT